MNNTVLGTALQEALAKKVDTSSYIWKGEKRKEGDKYVQESERIDEMTPERLKECYRHCQIMLNNDDPKNLGRYNLLDEINLQIKKCTIELLIRFFENKYKQDENRTPTPRTPQLWNNFRTLMSNNPEIEDWTLVPITQVASDLPVEFSNVNISELMDGCVDCLEAFDKKHLTMTFITKMGIWLSKSEELELKNVAKNNTEKLKWIKTKLHLPEKLVLRYSEKGLSYHEMRSILSLPKKQRYSDMTNEQLVLLSTKILPRLQKQIDSHIFSWKHLMRQLETVAKMKNIELND